MTPDPYGIPARSGEVLVVPPLDQLPALVVRREDWEWEGLALLGTPLADVRRRLRGQALRMAAAYTLEDPETAPPDVAEDGEGPLLVMGHQPVLFHPGVWVKFFLLTRLSGREGAVGLHLIGDTDAPGTVAATLPVLRGRLERVEELLADVGEEVPLEAASPPSAAAWEAFVQRVVAHVATLPVPGLVDRVQAFANGARAVQARARTLGEFLARARRRYEARAGRPAYLELPLSRLADTWEFRAFTLHLLQDPEELRGAYNAALEEYRRAHRIRSAANPFPNLEARSGRSETPFWVVVGGRRRDLLVARDGRQLVLGTVDGPLAVVPRGPDGVASLEAAGLVLRPKALTLTFFVRLCLADLFVHGVSGGRYDRVTDAVAARLLGCRLPPYVVATATLHLPLAASTAAEERRALRQRLLDLQHNPDRHLRHVSEDLRHLIDEKWALIRQVETLGAGPERRAATRRIREVNALLASALAPEIAQLEARLRALEERDAADEVVQYREYPFFLFDPSQVDALLGPRSSPEPAGSGAGCDAIGRGCHRP